MFDLTGFIKKNLIAGFRNGSFTAEQVNIFAVNYMLKGVFTEAHVMEVSAAIQPPAEPE
jgi:hypothetical protein